MKIGSVQAKLTVDSKTGEYILSYLTIISRAGWLKEIIAITEADAEMLNSSVPEVDAASVKQLSDRFIE